jgi:hypothetical protein
MEAFCKSARVGKPVRLSHIKGIDAFRGTPPSKA